MLGFSPLASAPLADDGLVTSGETPGVVALSAVDVVSAAPVSASCTLVQQHSIACVEALLGSAQVDTVSFAAEHALVVNSLAAGPPSIDSTAHAAIYAFEGTSAFVGSPILETATFVAEHALASDAAVTAAPELAPPTLTAEHALTALGNDLAAPNIAAPALTEVYQVAAAHAVSSAPVLDTPELSVADHMLSAEAVTAGAPVGVDIPVICDPQWDWDQKTLVTPSADYATYSYAVAEKSGNIYGYEISSYTTSALVIKQWWGFSRYPSATAYTYRLITLGADGSVTFNSFYPTNFSSKPANLLSPAALQAYLDDNPLPVSASFLPYPWAENNALGYWLDWAYANWSTLHLRNASGTSVDTFAPPASVTSAGTWDQHHFAPIAYGNHHFALFSRYAQDTKRAYAACIVITEDTATAFREIQSTFTSIPPCEAGQPSIASASFTQDHQLGADTFLVSAADPQEAALTYFYAFATDTVLAGSVECASPVLHQANLLGSVDALLVGAPSISPAELQQTQVFAAEPLWTDSTTVGTPSSTGAHLLSAFDLAPPLVSVPSANMAEDETFTTSDFTCSAILAEAPELVQEHLLGNVPTLSLNNVHVSEADVFQEHALDALNVESQAPYCAASEFAQLHSLSNGELFESFPSLEQPLITQFQLLAADAVDLSALQIPAVSPIYIYHLGTGDVVTASPSVEICEFWQNHDLVNASNNLPTVEPDAAALNQEHTLVGDEEVAGTPIASLGLLTQIHALETVAITGGTLLPGVGELREIHALASEGLALALSIDNAFLVERLSLTAQNLSAGAPDVAITAYTLNRVLYVEDASLAAFNVDSGELRQGHAFGSLDQTLPAWLISPTRFLEPEAPFDAPNSVSLETSENTVSLEASANTASLEPSINSVR